MTNATNRRAVLGAVIAAGATGALPSVARAASSHPDAELLALASEIEGADREYELREQARSAAENVFYSIRPRGRKFRQSPPMPWGTDSAEAMG